MPDCLHITLPFRLTQPIVLCFIFETCGTGLFVGYLTSNGMVKATPPELYSDLQQTETGYVFFPVTHLKVV